MWEFSRETKDTLERRSKLISWSETFQAHTKCSVSACYCVCVSCMCLTVSHIVLTARPTATYVVSASGNNRSVSFPMPVCRICCLYPVLSICSYMLWSIQRRCIVAFYIFNVFRCFFVVVYSGERLKGFHFSCFWHLVTRCMSVVSWFTGDDATHTHTHKHSWSGHMLSKLVGSS